MFYKVRNYPCILILLPISNFLESKKSQKSDRKKKTTTPKAQTGKKIKTEDAPINLSRMKDNASASSSKKGVNGGVSSRKRKFNM